MGAHRGGVVSHGLPQITMLFGVVAGSSVTIAVWFYEDATSGWQTFTGFTLTPNGVASNRTSLILGCRMNQKFFPQITANTLVQAFGYSLC